MEQNKQPQEVPRTTKKFLFWLLNRIIQRKQWWLMPFWVLLAALGIALALSGNGALLPAIYIAF